MKRFHVHAHVEDLPQSIAFYSKMFGAAPTRVEADYAKWMIEDPRLNFAISTRGSRPGIDHLGIQTDTEEELAELKARAEAADLALLDEGETSCCYARSDKHWLTDPQGIAWEHYRTLGDIPVFGQGKSAAPATTGAVTAPAASGSSPAAAADAGACCAPRAPRGKPIGVAITSTDKPSSSSCC